MIRNSGGVVQQAVGYVNQRSRKKLKLKELGVTSIALIVYESMGLWLSSLISPLQINSPLCGMHCAWNYCGGYDTQAMGLNFKGAWNLI